MGYNGVGKTSFLTTFVRCTSGKFGLSTFNISSNKIVSCTEKFQSYDGITHAIKLIDMPGYFNNFGPAEKQLLRKILRGVKSNNTVTLSDLALDEKYWFNEENEIDLVYIVLQMSSFQDDADVQKLVDYAILIREVTEKSPSVILTHYDRVSWSRADDILNKVMSATIPDTQICRIWNHEKDDTDQMKVSKYLTEMTLINFAWSTLEIQFGCHDLYDRLQAKLSLGETYTVNEELKT